MKVLFFGVDCDGCDGTAFEFRFDNDRIAMDMVRNLKHFGAYVDQYGFLWHLIPNSLEVVKDDGSKIQF